MGSVEIVGQKIEKYEKIQPFNAKNLCDFGFYLRKITGTYIH